jgi:tetratricopeptide (TPR) repeat protein
MIDAASLLADGVRLHQAGQLADAERIYQRILAALPDHFDSLHLLGLIFLQRGHHAQAVAQIDAALTRDPDNICSIATTPAGGGWQIARTVPGIRPRGCFDRVRHASGHRSLRARRRRWRAMLAIGERAGASTRRRPRAALDQVRHRIEYL